MKKSSVWCTLLCPYGTWTGLNQFTKQALRAYCPKIYCESAEILISSLLDLVAMKLLMKLARARYVYTAIVYTAIAIDVSAVWLTAVKTGDWFVPNGFTWIYSHSCHYAAASPNASVTFKTWWDQAYGMGKIFPLIEIRLKYLPRLGPMSPYVQARLQPSWAQQQFALFVASYTLSMFCIFHISWIKLDQIK